MPQDNQIEVEIGISNMQSISLSRAINRLIETESETIDSIVIYCVTVG